MIPTYIVDYDSDMGHYDILQRTEIQLHGKLVVTSNSFCTACTLAAANFVVKLLNEYHEKNNPIG